MNNWLPPDAWHPSPAARIPDNRNQQKGATLSAAVTARFSLRHNHLGIVRTYIGDVLALNTRDSVMLVSHWNHNQPFGKAP